MVKISQGYIWPGLVEDFGLHIKRLCLVFLGAFILGHFEGSIGEIEGLVSLTAVTT